MTILRSWLMDPICELETSREVARLIAIICDSCIDVTRERDQIFALHRCLLSSHIVSAIRDVRPKLPHHGCEVGTARGTMSVCGSPCPARPTRTVNEVEKGWPEKGGVWPPDAARPIQRGCGLLRTLDIVSSEAAASEAAGRGLPKGYVGAMSSAPPPKDGVGNIGAGPVPDDQKYQLLIRCCKATAKPLATAPAPTAADFSLKLWACSGDIIAAGCEAETMPRPPHTWQWDRFPTDCHGDSIALGREAETMTRPPLRHATLVWQWARLPTDEAFMLIPARPQGALAAL